jgi:hypothetical protein
MNTTTQPRKGESIFLVTVESFGETPGLVRYYFRPVIVESWGKKRGTASYTVNGKMTRNAIYTDRATWFRTIAEIEAFARETYVEYSRTATVRKLACEESVIPFVLPRFAAGLHARIAALRSAEPSFVIAVSPLCGL